MKCILICAGYATRLFPLTKNFPKALIEVSNRPILDYIIDKVNEVEEIDEIFVVTNDKYYEHFMNWNTNKNNVKNIKILNDYTKSNEDRLGAIGDINYTIKNENISDDIMVIAGDNLFDYNLTDVIDFYKKKNNVVVCCKQTTNIEALKASGVAIVDEKSMKVLELVEKPLDPPSDIMVYATYIYPNNIIPMIDKYLKDDFNPDAPGYLVQYLYDKVDVYAYKFVGNCFDVGTHEALEEVNKIYNIKKN